MLVDEKSGDPNCVYAEGSTYNWILGVYSEIINYHGSTKNDWKASLSSHFSNVKVQIPKQTTQRLIFQKIYHGMNLGLSLRRKHENGYFNYCDLVGSISDFYYGLYNLFISIAMIRDVPENQTHGKNITIFHNTKNILPYPFNIHGELNQNIWNGKTLINKNHFDCTLPGILTTNKNSAGKINSTYGNNILLSSSDSQDIIHGYLLGTLEWYISTQRQIFENENGKLNFRFQENKNLLNPRLKKLKINFMNCLYRYRTKAHYRDFTFLTYQYMDSDGKLNNTMNIKFYNCLATIIEFATCMTILHAKNRVGKNKIKIFLQDISNKFRDTLLPNEDYWNNLI